jgi:uncharacterized protein (DUF885 family)
VTNVTTEAVHDLGDAACKEIEGAARAIEEEAAHIAGELRGLVVALTEQSQYFAGRVSAFGEKAAEVTETIKALRARITEGAFVKADLQDDGTPIPQFFQTPLPEAAE